MFVKFKSIKFKNFLSYGSAIMEFHFKEGMNFIGGLNGSGKSGLITDTISFALFGRPFRKIKINELVNRRNRGSLYTEIEFDIDLTHYRIIRTLFPASIKIFKNGVELESLSSKGLVQDEINKLLGIDYTIFKQIISLAVNYNKPFLDLGITEKRDIIESIFNIKIFGEMSKILKKENVALKMQTDYDKKALLLLENNLKSQRNQLRGIKQTKEDFEKNKESDIQNIDNKLVDRTKEKEEIEAFLSTNKIVHEDKEKLETEKEAKDKELIILQKKMQKEIYDCNDIKKDMKVLEENTVCPTCSTELTDEHKKKHLTILATKKEIVDSAIATFKADKLNLVSKIDSLQLLIDEKNTILNKISTEKTKLSFIVNELKELAERKNEINTRVFNFDLEGLEKEFEKKKGEYIETHNKSEETAIQYKNNELVADILSDSGIKAYFFNKLIPILNQKINDYLGQFNLAVKFSFNTRLEESIIDIQNSFGKSVSYYGFSAGERKRIDIAILLSFIAMTKFICNWNSNLLIFDELLDTSIDEPGLEELLAGIKTMVIKNKLSVYVISHKIVENDIFNSTIRVTKNDGYSKLEYLEN
jgi:DNA repair exonuclease SbcCD ATPase subunit